MTNLNITTKSALTQGIKAVGVGKKGSKSLSRELAEEILKELQNSPVSTAAKGAFFGALIIKGLSEEERILEKAFLPGTLSDPLRLIEAIAPDAPLAVKEICVRLLRQKTLDQTTAKQLGNFLFSGEPGDGARGLAVSILRVRYETPEEYSGLLLSLQETFETSFRSSIPKREPIIQIAEPFDGVDQSNMITPLVGEYLQRLNYRVVHLVGRNSGPKMVLNLLDIAQDLNTHFLKQNSKFTDPNPSFGWFLNQQDLSKPMDRWVEIRREIIKRPFLATLERFVNPLKADIIIASAFHAPYGEKMLTIGEGAGFPGIIIVRNGIEGTIAFPLKRATKILCSKKQKNGSYTRHEIEFDSEKFLGETVAVEEKLENPSLERNVELIRSYHLKRKTDSRHFDLRVKATCEGIRLAIHWINEDQT